MSVGISSSAFGLSEERISDGAIGVMACMRACDALRTEFDSLIAPNPYNLIRLKKAQTTI